MNGPVPQDVGQRLCAAWGINQAYCARIVIDWEQGRLPVATVTLLVSEQIVQQLLTLVPIERMTVQDGLS